MTNECYFKTNKVYQPTQDPFFVVQGMQKVQQFSVAAIKYKNTLIKMTIFLILPSTIIIIAIESTGHVCSCDSIMLKMLD